jgi:hypothetical protein
MKPASKMTGAETISVALKFFCDRVISFGWQSYPCQENDCQQLVDLSSSTPHVTTVTHEPSPAISAQPNTPCAPIPMRFGRKRFEL